MMRSKRFEPIQEIASTSASQLSRVMGDAGRKVAEIEVQFEQLQKYRDDYVNGSTDGVGGMDAAKLQNYRAFIGRLGEAIRQQSTLLDRARAEYENRRLAWSAKRIEAESLERVVRRLRKEEQTDADRQEQRDGDESAMRITIARAEAVDG